MLKVLLLAADGSFAANDQAFTKGMLVILLHTKMFSYLKKELTYVFAF